MYQPNMQTNPETYEENCCFPIVAIHHALSVYSSKLGVALPELKIKGRVLDVGCGPGAVTRCFLQHIHPSGSLDACDISPEVIERARNDMDVKANYFVMDATKEIKKELLDSYDFIFSSFMLHWIRDHRPVLKNFISMMKDGAQCLICFFANQAVFASYRDLAKMSTWGPYMQDVGNFITPYQDDGKVDETYKQLMMDCGFINVDVTKVEINYSFARIQFFYENYKNILVTVDPFLPRLPKEKKDSYIHDLMEAYKQNNGFRFNEINNEQTLEGTGELLIAIGSK